MVGRRNSLFCQPLSLVIGGHSLLATLSRQPLNELLSHSTDTHLLPDIFFGSGEKDELHGLLIQLFLPISSVTRSSQGNSYHPWNNLTRELMVVVVHFPVMFLNVIMKPNTYGHMGHCESTAFVIS